MLDSRRVDRSLVVGRGARKGTRLIARLAVVVLAASAGLAWSFGQPEKDAPKAPPAKPAPSAERTIEEMEKGAPGRETIKPTMSPKVESVLPGSAGGGGGGGNIETRGRLLREGSFLASRRGRMVRSSSGEWVFTFDSDAQGKSDPPMILMPCLNLMAMEKIAERAGEALTFTISGQVFVYHGKNYLLPTMYVINRGNESGQK